MRKLLSKFTGMLSEIVLTVFALCGTVILTTFMFVIITIAILIVGPFATIHDAIAYDILLSDSAEEFIKGIFKGVKNGLNKMLKDWASALSFFFAVITFCIMEGDEYDDSNNNFTTHIDDVVDIYNSGY